MRDFNCVMTNEERIGATVRQQDMEELKECVEKCEMQDLTCSGDFYT